MSIRTINLETGEETERELTAQELADMPVPDSREAIRSQIYALEASITPRRMREATLGTDNGWLNGVDAQIAILRIQL